MHVYIIGDSVTSNSLGRAISMAITAEAVFPTVQLLALDDGPTWAGAAQFGVPVEVFKRAQLPSLKRRLKASGADEGCIVWLSKCARPLDQLIRGLVGAPGVTVIADFDDNDIAIMQSFRAQNALNRIKMNRLRRKHPESLRASQKRAAKNAAGLTFSSETLATEYRSILAPGTKPHAVVPHSRKNPSTTASDRPSTDGGLRLGFVGTVRAHKGADRLVALMRADRSVSIATFAQSWTPPEDCLPQWITFSAGEPLERVYRDIDFLVLPMSDSDRASLDQLPAKFVDAASFACPVAATPTPPLLQFANGAFLQVESWADPGEVIKTLRAANREELSSNLRQVFETQFSPTATSHGLMQLLSTIQKVSVA